MSNDDSARRRSSPLTDSGPEPGHCSVELRHRILGQASYFSGLSAQALEAVNARFREQHFKADQVIFREGEPAQRLAFVAHGKVKLLRHSLRGDDVVLDLLPQGSLFGGLTPLGDLQHSETAVAQTDCCILTVGADAFDELLSRHSEVASAVLRTVAQRLEDARETIRQLMVAPVEARLATALLKLAERLGESSEEGVLIQTPLPQQDLAAMVGATPETVSRIMAKFKRGGLVEGGRQWVRVVDMDALKALAAT